MKQKFVELFLSLVPANTPPSSVVLSVQQFEDEYNNILERVETTTKKRNFVQKTFDETRKGQDIIKDPKKKDKKKKNKKKGGDADGDGEDDSDEEADSQPRGSGETDVDKNKRLFIGNIFTLRN